MVGFKQFGEGPEPREDISVGYTKGEPTNELAPSEESAEVPAAFFELLARDFANIEHENTPPQEFAVALLSKTTEAELAALKAAVEKHGDKNFPIIQGVTWGKAIDEAWTRYVKNNRFKK